MPNSSQNDNSNESNRPGPRDKIGVLEEIARRFEENAALQSAIFNIAELASSSHDIQSCYEQMHGIVKGLTSASNFFIALLDEDNQHIYFPYYRDGDRTDHPRVVRKLHDSNQRSFTRSILEQGKMIHVSREEIVEQERSLGVEADVSATPEDWLGIPLTEAGKAFGALVVHSYHPGFRYSKRDERLLTYIGRHIANALQRKYYADSLQSAHDELKQKNDALKEVADGSEQMNQKLLSSLKERKKIERELAHSASHDSLTGLPNRACLLANLREVVHESETDPKLEFAVLFLDLDRFKVVNDSLGHLAGDALLREVATRLRTCVRPSDTVARFGGDEFCILLKSNASLETINQVSNRILRTLSLPVDLSGQPVVISTSIGVTVGTLGYNNAEDMLRDADTALYRVKANGKASYQIFNRSMREQAVNRLQLEQDLRTAVAENHIQVHYQPIVDIRTGQIVSFEALARWEHPEMGMVPAGEFIPIAEEINLLPQLTTAVLSRSIEQVCHWRREIPGMQNVGLNINISSSQIESGGCVETVQRILKRSKLPPRCLKLEVTESLLLNNVEAATDILNRINAMEVKLALDDFGTGYSSLSCLNSLPLHELKIDLSFVRNIVTDPRCHAIVQMIVALADVMCLKVVAEGIENEAQLSILRSLQVDYAQGFLFGQPASSTSVTKTLVQISNSFPSIDSISIPTSNLTSDF